MRGFEAGCEETREAARKWGNHGGRDRAASLSIGDDMSNLNFHFYFHFLSFLCPSHVWIHSEIICQVWGLEEVFQNEDQRCFRPWSSHQRPCSQSGTQRDCSRPSQCSPAPRCWPWCWGPWSSSACWSRPATPSSASPATPKTPATLKTSWSRWVLKPLHCKKGLEQADKPAGTDEWYCKRGSRLLLALYTPPTLALSLEAASDDM